jgi:hypothetical protein
MKYLTRGAFSKLVARRGREIVEELRPAQPPRRGFKVEQSCRESRHPGWRRRGEALPESVMRALPFAHMLTPAVPAKYRAQSLAQTAAQQKRQKGVGMAGNTGKKDHHP